MKKLVKTVSLCLLMIVAVLALTSCGSNKTLTYSQFFDTENDRIIGYYIESDSGIAKDDWDDYIFVFENNTLTIYKWVWIDFGDITKMSDDEVIQYCKDNCDKDKIFVYDTYRVVAYTDSTGNNVYAEGVQVLNNDGNYEFPIMDAPFFGTETYEIYDSEFMALVSHDYLLDRPIYLAFKDSPAPVFDSTDAENVIIDP